ncbi:MAG: HD-GYP domain-containing protein [Candidatus Baltobacteraceae bacterium]
MTLFQGTASTPSETGEAFGHMISLFGAVGDYALGNPAGYGPQIGSLAAAIAQIGGCEPQQCDTIQLAGVLHGIGALGNGGLRKSDALPPRAAMMERWNIPATGALMCEQIPGLPKDTADIVRWHAEAWDGTGYPDQLRWHGIPRAAQLLHIAEMFVEHDEPEDALAKIQESSGRIFSPDEVRTFVMWFHSFGGEIQPRQFPAAALTAGPASHTKVLALLSEAIDAHNGTRGRAERIAERCAATAALLKLDAHESELLNASARLFGIGEMSAAELEWHRFDPLAGLGRELRARHAVESAQVVGALAPFKELIPILRARGEWFDGTGLPDRLRSEKIPMPSRILSVCIAHDAVDEAHRTHIRDDRTTPLERMEWAAGTQFDPAVVRAYTEALKAKA